MSKKQMIRVTAVDIQRQQATPALGEAAAPTPLKLSLAVQNPTSQPLHVWGSWRSYEYDAESRVLTVYMTEHTPPLPPGITMISNHPRTPRQVMVPANGEATVTITVPASIRRRVPGAGLGMNFVEEPIGAVDCVEMHIQSSNEPVEPAKPGESPDLHRERLRQSGDVVRTTITPTKTKEK